MTTELPISPVPNDVSPEPNRDLAIEPGEVDNLLLAKGHAAPVDKAATEKRLELIKQFRNYKSSKNALNAKGGRLRGEPIRIERARSSGSRRKQP